eukprot:SAG22_NODE_181_length_16048_cov_157.464418_16_plen_71_part_00
MLSLSLRQCLSLPSVRLSLQFPKLRHAYFELVSFMVETYPVRAALHTFSFCGWTFPHCTSHVPIECHALD